MSPQTDKTRPAIETPLASNAGIDTPRGSSNTETPRFTDPESNEPKVPPIAVLVEFKGYVVKIGSVVEYTNPNIFPQVLSKTFF